LLRQKGDRLHSPEPGTTLFAAGRALPESPHFRHGSQLLRYVALNARATAVGKEIIPSPILLND
jgi:hypothetical protein